MEILGHFKGGVPDWAGQGPNSEGAQDAKLSSPFSLPQSNVTRESRGWATLARACHGGNGDQVQRRHRSSALWASRKA
jgi:hypothetical protein